MAAAVVAFAASSVSTASAGPAPAVGDCTMVNRKLTCKDGAPAGGGPSVPIPAPRPDLAASRPAPGQPVAAEDIPTLVWRSQQIGNVTLCGGDRLSVYYQHSLINT